MDRQYTRQDFKSLPAWWAFNVFVPVGTVFLILVRPLLRLIVWAWEKKLEKRP